VHESESQARETADVLIPMSPEELTLADTAGLQRLRAALLRDVNRTAADLRLLRLVTRELIRRGVL
jgi:hypothetical protein